MDESKKIFQISLLSSAAWLALCLGILFKLGRLDQHTQWVGVINLYVLTCLDLYLLSKVVARMMGLVSETKDKANQRLIRIGGLFFWFTLKLLGVLALVFALKTYKSLDGVTQLFAVSPVIMVPLIAGIVWSFRHE